MLQAQGEQAADAEDAPGDEEAAVGKPEAASEGNKSDVHGPAGKAVDSDVAADAAEQEPKNETSTKPADQASNATRKGNAKEAEGELKEEKAPSLAAGKKPETPATVADRKPDAEKAELKTSKPVSEGTEGNLRGTKAGPEAATTGAAADTSVANSRGIAPESESNKHNSKHLDGVSLPGPSSAKKSQLAEAPAATTAPAAAPAQAGADDSAAPQVDVLGSVEVAAPLQVGHQQRCICWMYPGCISFLGHQQLMHALT